MAVSPPSPSALGATVRALRQERGLTLEDLADEAHFNVTYLSDLERGRANPTIAKLGDLAVAFDVALSDLIASAERNGQP
jgi:transcriptional regulator with XRE-family HTH domain